MRNKKTFSFKEFSLSHERSIFKIGTDSVLLAALIPDYPYKSILDIGAGCGVISLLLANRFKEAVIEGIEYDTESCNEAKINALNLGLTNRVNFIYGNFLEFNFNKTFDLIVSNPPYFDIGQGVENKRKQIARQMINLPLADLINNACKWMHDKSYIALVLPIYLSDELNIILKKNSLKIVFKIFFKHQEFYPIKRLVVFISHENLHCEQEEKTLTLFTSLHVYTKETQALLSPYLKYL